MTSPNLLSQIRDAQSAWETILSECIDSSVFLTPEWQQAWWSEFGKGDALHLVMLKVHNRALGLAPLCISQQTISFVGDTDLFDYHDFIVREEDSEAFYPALVDYLQDQPWAKMVLTSLKEDSKALEYLPKLYRGLGYSVSVEEEDLVPGMSLPLTWEEYLSSLRKKDRHELKRKFRRLDEYGSYRVLREYDVELSESIDTFLSLMEESKEEKRAFLNTQRENFFREIVHTMHQIGSLRLFFLELDGAIVAGVLCFDYAGRRFLYNSGYRLAQASNSVGLLLKALCIRDAIENGLTYFDFLRGSEQYKYHLGAQTYNLYSLVVNR